MLGGGIPTPLKNMKVAWDDEIPNIWEQLKMFQTTNQIMYDWYLTKIVNAQYKAHETIWVNKIVDYAANEVQKTMDSYGQLWIAMDSYG